MKKRGQGMPLNVIIIAVLALLVLVVLAIVFMGRLGVFGVRVQECGGVCVVDEEACADKYGTGNYKIDALGGCDMGGDGKYNNQDEDGVCCIGVGIS